MKKSSQAAVAGVMMALVIFAAIYATGGLKFQTYAGSLPLECKLIIPTWSFYSCERAQVDGHLVYTAQFPGNLFGFSYIDADELACTQNDIIDIGTQTCKYTVKAVSAITGGVYRAPTYAGLPMHVGQTFYLPYGSRLQMRASSLVAGSISIEKTYPQKVLYKNNWGVTGGRWLIGSGCDMNTLLSGTEKSVLPPNVKLGMNVGETVNFIDVFTSVPIAGNYYDNPTYGAVVVGESGPPYSVYKISPLAGATKDSKGKYVTTGGTCYFTADANPVTTFTCMPGATQGSSTCGSDGKWTSLDKGVCIRGGLTSNQLCPGGGSNYCDLATHTSATYTCNAVTGNCDAGNVKSNIECCPGSNSGCTADKECSASYTCVAKPSGKSACPYDWCQGSTNYLDKNCVSGLQPCRDISYYYGSCKADCSGIPPVTPPSQTCYNEGQNVGKTVFSPGGQCCTGLIQDANGNCVKTVPVDWQQYLPYIAVAGAALVMVFLVMAKRRKV